MFQLSLSPVAPPVTSPILAAPAAATGDFALALAGAAQATEAAKPAAIAEALPPVRQILAAPGEVADPVLIDLPVETPPLLPADAPNAPLAQAAVDPATPIALPRFQPVAVISQEAALLAATVSRENQNRGGNILHSSPPAHAPVGPHQRPAQGLDFRLLGNDNPDAGVEALAKGDAEPATKDRDITPSSIDLAPPILPVALPPAPSIGAPIPVPPPVADSPSVRAPLLIAPSPLPGGPAASRVIPLSLPTLPTSDPAPPIATAADAQPVAATSPTVAPPASHAPALTAAGAPVDVVDLPGQQFAPPSVVIVDPLAVREVSGVTILARPASINAVLPMLERPVAEAALPTVDQTALPESPPIQPPAIGVAVPALRAFAAGIAATAARPLRERREDEPFTAPLAATSRADPTTPRLDVADRAQPPIDTRRDDWTRALIDRIDAVRDVANARDTRIRLVPDALGKIDVALRQDGDTLHVQFAADAPATRAMLADAQPRLAELAEVRGLRIGDATVSAGSSNPGAGNAPGSAFAQAGDQRRPAPSTPAVNHNRSMTTDPTRDGADHDQRIA